MKKLILLLLMLCVIPLALGITVTLNAPGNNSWDTDGSIVFNFTVTGNDSTYDCNLYHNLSQAWGQDGTLVNSSTTNNTATTFTKSSISDQTGKIWNIRCEGTNAGTGWKATNNTINLDSVDPTVSVNSPTDVSWDTDGAVVFNITATDTNMDTCIFATNLNLSANTTGAWNSSGESFTPTTATAYNLSFGAGSNTWADERTGAYLWQVVCNDSAGNENTAINWTFYVDSVDPTEPNLTAIFVGDAVTTTGWTSAGTGSTSTDYTPKINWTAVTELNFSRYLLRIYNSTPTLIYSVNVSAKATNYHIVLTDLDADMAHAINVTAYDVAGNSKSSATNYAYTTDSTCHTLLTGWNICAYTRTTARNASILCNETACDYISKYNSSHEFQTFTAGASSNAGMTFNSSDNPDEDAVLFIYVSSDTDWEHELWEVGATNDDLWWNFTNASTEGWNLVPLLVQNSSVLPTNFQELDLSIAGNGTDILYSNYTTYFSMYVEENATGSKYIPFVSNWTLNNATAVDYGEAFWAYFSTTITEWTWNSSGEIS